LKLWGRDAPKQSSPIVLDRRRFQRHTMLNVSLPNGSMLGGSWVDEKHYFCRMLVAGAQALFNNDIIQAQFGLLHTTQFMAL